MIEWTRQRENGSRITAPAVSRCDHRSVRLSTGLAWGYEAGNLAAAVLNSHSERRFVSSRADSEEV